MLQVRAKFDDKVYAMKVISKRMLKKKNHLSYMRYVERLPFQPQQGGRQIRHNRRYSTVLHELSEERLTCAELPLRLACPKLSAAARSATS